MEYVLKTNGLCKQYRNLKALNGLSMNIPKGAIYGFVGKNGAGKTTLIRLVCGLQFPTSGDFELYGVKNTDSKMGAVVETPSIYPSMTAEENLKTQYRLLGMPSFDGIQELLKLVGLENTGKKKAKNFSLGMKQRLGIAIALCGNPDLLILDEPINGLDPQGIIEVRELILKLNGFIDSGRIVKEMSAEELEQACRKCIHMEVTDTKILARVLDGMGIAYKILDEKTADVYAKPVFSGLALALSKEGCEVISMSEHYENLEGFFMELVGGAKA